MSGHVQKANHQPIFQPRPSSANQGISDASQLSSSHLNQDDQDGYQLQPVAYNPNAKTEDYEDSRQSWRKGDDLESMQPSPSAQAPPKPPKIPKDHRSDIVQKIQVAPQLPPLYFESGSQTQQYDFAYDQQSNQHAHHQNIPRGQEPLRLAPNIPKPSENKFPSSPLPQPPPQSSSHVQFDNQRAFAANSQQGFTLPIAAGTREQAPPYPDRPPPAPTLPRIASTSEAQQPVSNMPISDNGCLPPSASPLKSDRPSMPRIATGNPEATGENPRGLSGADSSRPEQVDHLNRESKEDGQGIHSSFYWHSPQSSTDTTLNRSPTAIDINDTGDSALPVRSTTNVESGSGFYNASALGFGGPSDWEHFGDYNGEEIDDTDLYITAKPKVETDRSEGAGGLPGLIAAKPETAALPDTVELPAIKLPAQEAAARPLDIKIETSLDEPRKQSVTEASEGPGSSEVSQPKQLNLDLTHEPDNISDSEEEEASGKVLRERDSTPAPIESGHSGSEQGTSLLENRDLNECSTAGVHSLEPEPPSLEPLEQQENPQLPTKTVRIERASIQTSPEESESESNNEWEDNSSNGDEQLHDTPLHMGQDEMKIDPVEKGDQKDGKIDGDYEQHREVDEGIKINTARDNNKIDDDSQQHHATSESINISSVHDKSKIADSPGELHEANEEINIETVTSEDKSDECDETTTREDDKAHEAEEDGGEDIIISLEMPALDESTIPSTQLQDRRISESNETHLPHVNYLDSPIQESSEGGRPQRRSVFPKSIELIDPYANLDPWAKASLNRYVKMLREEAQAEKDEDKYMIFMTFTRRESRLRAVLYDVDDEPEPVESVLKRAPLKGSTSIVTLRQPPSIISKALPALPPDAEPYEGPKVNTAPKKIVTYSQSNEKLKGKSDKLLETVSPRKASPTKTPFKEQASSTPKAPSDESFVMVDTSGVEQLAPLKKPLTAQHSKEDKGSPLKVTPSLTSLRKALDMVANQASAAFGKDIRSPALDKPSAFGANTADQNLQIDTPRSNSVPPLSTTGAGTNVPQAASDRPAYVPFRYNEGRPYEGDKASNRQSIYRPFSMSLRPGSSTGEPVNTRDSIDQHEDRRAGSSVPQPENSSLDLNIGVKPLPGDFEKGVGKTQPRKPAPEIPANQRNSILGPLFVVIPRTNILYPEPQQLSNLTEAMKAIPDEFGFIHKAVLTWDAEAKHKREQYDKDRHVRQGESEHRIDALFNDNEIGYGDISELEAEFKRSEAARKADEDRAEFQSFVTQVFDGVWTRLHYEMDQLHPYYETCTRLVKEASAGKDMFEDPDDRVPIAPAMENLLILHQKLSIRHQKAFEAVLERDRRLKKTEVAPWYALGNIPQVKKIEKRFEDAEKKAILDFCLKRDERANRLMDVLDQNTLRGVGANQDYMESVMQAVRKIAMEVALGAVPEDTVISTDEILKAKTITTALARSSEQIVKTFHVADMLLNAADYEVSVANARNSNADAASFKHLRDAKGKEDQKLVKDLEHRLSLIRGDTSRTLDEIAKLLSLLGNYTANSSPPRSTSAPADPDREARLLIALEEAKRRNAQKEAETSGGP